MYFFEEANRTTLSLSFGKYFSILMLGGEAMETIGYRIKKLRSYAKITQKDLTEKLGISDKTLSRYEKDENTPDVYALVRIATYFDVSVDYLLGIGGLKAQMMEDEIVNDRKDLYKRYIQCRENYSIYEDTLYYWIYSENYGKDKGDKQNMWGLQIQNHEKKLENYDMSNQRNQ